MVDKTNKWVIDVELNSSKVLSQYESMLKRMSSLEKRYSQKNQRFSTSRGFAGPSSRIGTSLGGGMKLDVDIENQLNKLAGMKMPSQEVERFKNQLEGIRNRLNMAQSSRSVMRLRNEFRDTTSQIRLMSREHARYNQQLSKSSMLGNAFASSLKRAAIAGASIYALGKVGGVIFRVGREMDSMRAALMAASATSEEATENFQFLKDTANVLGKDIQSAVGGFNRIAVAARGAGFGTEEARHIFLAASEASTAFALDSQRTGLVMLAFSQMISKGRVSMEELSRQLGENLPITLEAAQMATGKTTSELIKMIESGQLMSKDFIIPFANSIRLLSRRNNALAVGQKKLIANQARMNNAWKELVDEIFQDKAAETFSNLFGLIARITKGLSPALKSISRVLFTVFDIFIDIFDVVGDIVALLMDIPLVGGLIKGVWGGILAVFHTIAGVFYEILATLYSIKNWQPPEWLRLMFDPKFMSDKISMKLESSGVAQGARDLLGVGATTNNKSVSIEKVEIQTNSSDPKGIFDQFNRFIYDLQTGS